MNFSIVYWNIWLDNQIHGPKHERAKTLQQSLQNIVERYNPDCIGMNEVLKKIDSSQTPFALKYLEKLGYTHTYYVSSGRWSDKWEIGDAFASKYPVDSVDPISLGDHYTAEGRSKAGEQAKALHATVKARGQNIHVVVAHLMHLRPQTWTTHLRHRDSLTAFAARYAGKQPLIIGGDFNEFKWMPFSFAGRNRQLFSRTGSLVKPTWYLKAQSRTLVGANPDKIFWPKQSAMQLVSFEVIQNNTSDHRPIYAKFSIGADT